jgi:hypothetical protein
MTCRHAAALALVGWYLMVPPAAETPRFDVKAPLNKWAIDSRFNTGGECRNTLAARRAKEARKDVEPRLWSFGKCVASDDPRLTPEQKRSR